MRVTRTAMIVGILAIALISAACIQVLSGEDSEAPAAIQEPAQQADVVVETREVSLSYDPQRAHSEAYWYSRFNLANLVMRSGMGVQLKPPMEKVEGMMEMAGISEGPANPYLVQALYSSGDPHLIQEFNGNDGDFANFRWDPSKMDRTIVPQAMGYTIIKEVIWAKSFASDVEGSDPMNHFRALVLSAEAAAQASFAAENLKTADGLFVSGWKDGEVSDPETAPQDQIVMLWALSELADYTTGAYGWYAAPITQDQASEWADELILAIEQRTRVEPGYLTAMPSRDVGVALSALASYATYGRHAPSTKIPLMKLI